MGGRRWLKLEGLGLVWLAESEELEELEEEVMGSSLGSKKSKIPAFLRSEISADWFWEEQRLRLETKLSMEVKS